MKVGGKKETEVDLKWTSLYTCFFVLMALFPVVDQSVGLRLLWGNGLLIQEGLSSRDEYQ